MRYNVETAEPASASGCTYSSLAYSAQPFLNLHLLSRLLLHAHVWFIRISVHRLLVHQCVGVVLGPILGAIDIYEYAGHRQECCIPNDMQVGRACLS